MDSFSSRSTLDAGGDSFALWRLDALEESHRVSRLPFSLKILLENLLRNEDGRNVTKAHVEALASWQPKATQDDQIAFSPARGDPAGLHRRAGGRGSRRHARRHERSRRRPDADQPADSRRSGHRPLGHGRSLRLHRRARSEPEARVQEERRALPLPALGAGRLRRLPRRAARHRHRPPGEPRVPRRRGHPPRGRRRAHRLPRHPRRHRFAHHDDQRPRRARLGRRRHRGRSGHARSARSRCLLPKVVGFGLHGKLPPGATATDLVLVVVEMLREKGVVGKFVEFHGEGLSSLSLADRATIANMAPEYGATCGILPDRRRDALLPRAHRARDERCIERVEAYAKAQGLWREDGAAPAEYTDTLDLDLADVRPSIAGPKRPQDRIALDVAARTFREHLTAQGELAANEAGTEQTTRYDGEGGEARRRTGRRGDGGGGRARRPVRARRGEARAQRRPRRHRGHHVLHQHLQPLGHDGRGPGCQEGPREGPDPKALGQDLARAGLAGRAALPRERGPPRAELDEIGFHVGRLRLHHLHRQLRPAARVDQPRDQRQRSWSPPPCSRATATSRAA